MKIPTPKKNKQWLKTLPKRVSSATMILENSIGQVLIVKSEYKSYWTFPGGIIDARETPKEAAIRETFEEVGIILDPQKVTFVAVVDRRSDYAETYQFIFKAPLLLGGINKIVLQASEIEEYQLITRDQLRTDDRPYGKVIKYWAASRSGYIEQTFGEIERA
jgi:8-oxo-dGTP pyrophosphatase MutT (NUDIX family)